MVVQIIYWKETPPSSTKQSCQGTTSPSYVYINGTKITSDKKTPDRCSCHSHCRHTGTCPHYSSQVGSRSFCHDDKLMCRYTASRTGPHWLGCLSAPKDMRQHMASWTPRILWWCIHVLIGHNFTSLKRESISLVFQRNVLLQGNLLRTEMLSLHTCNEMEANEDAKFKSTHGFNYSKTAYI